MCIRYCNKRIRTDKRYTNVSMYRLIRTLHKNKVSYQSIRECGLLAYFMFGRLDSKNIHDRTSTMDKALKTLHHRGPENRGLWFSDNQRVGLGHVRLSIIDLSSAGDQPLFNENKSIALVVNGEVGKYYLITLYLTSRFSYMAMKH